MPVYKVSLARNQEPVDWLRRVEEAAGAADTVVIDLPPLSRLGHILCDRGSRPGPRSSHSFGGGHRSQCSGAEIDQRCTHGPQRQGPEGAFGAIEG
jgi:hypothetical protein